MPDLPASVYVPIAGALISALGVVISISSLLLRNVWKQLNEERAARAADNRRLFDQAPPLATALSQAAEAINSQARVQGDFPSLVREVTRGINRLDSLVMAFITERERNTGNDSGN